MMIVHVGCLILKEGKILLVRRQDKDIWELPGGKVEEGEELEEASKRELLEELSINIEIIQAFNEYQFIENEEKYNSTVFECNILKGKIIELEEGIQKSEFIELSKIGEYNVSDKVKAIVKDLR